MKINVTHFQNEQKSELVLNDTIWKQTLHRDAVYKVVVAMQAAQRQGSHMTKTRAMVSGGGRKPWKQKGTGRARHGSNRSPIWRKGGIVFGPNTARNYNLKVNKKMRQLAFRSVLASKLNEQKLTVCANIKCDEYKTKVVQTLLRDLKLQDAKTLIVTAELNPKLLKSAANLPNVKVSIAHELDTITVMKAQQMLVTVDAMKQLEKRCK